MDSSVIREFLVQLGYEVNQTQQREFVRGMEKSTKVVAGLGVALTALVAGTVAAANAMEKFYFSSQRSGSSVRGIQSMQFAVANLGGSAEGALNAIESIARFMREKPGGESWIKALGVQTRDANGQMRDTSEIMADIGKRLAAMPYYRASRYAQVLGIDEKTLIALREGVGDFSDRYKDLLHRFGLNVDEATKKSHRLMIAWRDMKAQASIFGTIVWSSVIDAFIELRRQWDALDDTQKANIETGAKWAAGLYAGLAVITGGPLVWIPALAAAIVALWNDYQVWEEGGKSLINWGKWKPELDAATEAINGLVEAMRALIRLKQKLESTAVSAVDSVGASAAARAAQIHRGATPNDVREQNSPTHNLLKRLARAAGYDPNTGRRYPNLGIDDPRGATGGDTSGNTTPRGIRNRNPGNLMFMGQDGATLEPGVNARFAAFNTPQAGLNALAQQLALYGSRGVDTINAITAKYAPEGENDTAAYAASLAKALGVAPGAKLNLQDPAVMQGLMRGIVSHENGQNPYSSDMYRQAAAGAGATSRTLHQETTINVNGARDAVATGREVERRQNDVNQRAARNLMPVAS